MKVPSSTYRLQLNSTFRFEDVEELLTYFTDLGVSDLYASPILKARKGSSHGYDVADHRVVSRELGGLAGWEALAEQLGRHRIGWIQDIVPNHMVFHHDNPILIDVLENGPASKYAELFDVDWQHPSPRLKGKILAPFLGEYYGDALEAGKLRLR